MKKIFDFLKSRAALIAAVNFILFIFYVSMSLGEQNMLYFSIAADIVIFVFSIYLIFDYISFNKQLSAAEENLILEERNEILRAEKISEEKNLQEYFMMWVHQIKTPITAAELLAKEKGSEERDARLKIQLIYIEQYADMAMNYIKLMKHERDMDIAEIELDEIIKGVLKKYSAIFISKRIELKYVPVKIKIITDGRWMSVLIEQFVSNALKYTENGFIRISYDGEEEKLIIEDSGIGIRSEDIPKIFDKGYSGFNGRLNRKSSGLGLYLAKRIGEKLSVDIDVKSEIEKGSCFGLSFRRIRNNTFLS